jgi:hypothetical protein
MEKTRLNLTLPKALDQRLNHYVLEVAKKQGKIPHDIRAKITRAALKEWLSKHEKDLDTLG